MFKAALEATQKNSEDVNLGVNSISPDAFVAVSHRFGFLSGDHRTYMPPRPLTRKDSMQMEHQTVDLLKVDESMSHKESELSDFPEGKDQAKEIKSGIHQAEESSSHSAEDWDELGETRKKQVMLGRRNSMIHQSAHDLVLGKVQELLTKAVPLLGEKHPKVAETLFIMRAYKRKMTDRTAFHRLTRATQALADFLDSEEEKQNAKLILEGAPSAEGNKEGDIREGEKSCEDEEDEEVVVIHEASNLDLS